MSEIRTGLSSDFGVSLYLHNNDLQLLPDQPQGIHQQCIPSRELQADTRIRRDDEWAKMRNENLVSHGNSPCTGQQLGPVHLQKQKRFSFTNTKLSIWNSEAPKSEHSKSKFC